jgi:hypothetical protein
MEPAVSSSETLVYVYQTTRRHIPDDSNLQKMHLFTYGLGLS